MGGGSYGSASQAMFSGDVTNQVEAFHFNLESGEAKIDFVTSNAAGVLLSFSGWSADEGQISGVENFTMEHRTRKPGRIEEYNSVTAEFKEEVVTVTLSGDSAKNAERIYKENSPALFGFVNDTINCNKEWGGKDPDIDDYLPRTIERSVKRFIKNILN